MTVSEVMGYFREAMAAVCAIADELEVDARQCDDWQRESVDARHVSYAPQLKHWRAAASIRSDLIGLAVSIDEPMARGLISEVIRRRDLRMERL